MQLKHWMIWLSHVRRRIFLGRLSLNNSRQLFRLARRKRALDRQAARMLRQSQLQQLPQRHMMSAGARSSFGVESVFYHDMAPRYEDAVGPGYRQGSRAQSDSQQLEPGTWGLDSADWAPPAKAAYGQASNRPRAHSTLGGFEVGVHQASAPRSAHSALGGAAVASHSDPDYFEPSRMSEIFQGLLCRQAQERADQEARLELAIERSLELRRRHGEEEAHLHQKEETGLAVRPELSAITTAESGASHYHGLLLEEWQSLQNAEDVLLPTLASPVRTTTPHSPSPRVRHHPAAPKSGPNPAVTTAAVVAANDQDRASVILPRSRNVHAAEAASSEHYHHHHMHVRTQRRQAERLPTHPHTEAGFHPGVTPTIEDLVAEAAVVGDPIMQSRRSDFVSASQPETTPQRTGQSSPGSPISHVETLFGQLAASPAATLIEDDSGSEGDAAVASLTRRALLPAQERKRIKDHKRQMEKEDKHFRHSLRAKNRNTESGNTSQSDSALLAESPLQSAAAVSTAARTQPASRSAEPNILTGTSPKGPVSTLAKPLHEHNATAPLQALARAITLALDRRQVASPKALWTVQDTQAARLKDLLEAAWSSPQTLDTVPPSLCFSAFVRILSRIQVSLCTTELISALAVRGWVNTERVARQNMSATGWPQWQLVTTLGADIVRAFCQQPLPGGQAGTEPTLLLITKSRRKHWDLSGRSSFKPKLEGEYPLGRGTSTSNPLPVLQNPRGSLDSIASSLGGSEDPAVGEIAWAAAAHLAQPLFRPSANGQFQSQLAQERSALRRQCKTVAAAVTAMAGVPVAAGTQSRPLSDADRRTNLRELLTMQPPLLLQAMINCPGTEVEGLTDAVLQNFAARNATEQLVRVCVWEEVGNTESAATLLRGNTRSLRVLTALARSVSGSFLTTILEDVLQAVISVPQFYSPPVNKKKADMDQYEQTIAMAVQTIVNSLVQQLPNMPGPLRLILYELRAAVALAFPEHEERALRAFLFLRFLSPALISPAEYGLLPSGIMDAPLDAMVMAGLLNISRLLVAISSGVSSVSKLSPQLAPFEILIVQNQQKVFWFVDNASIPLPADDAGQVALLASLGQLARRTLSQSQDCILNFLCAHTAEVQQYLCGLNKTKCVFSTVEDLLENFLASSIVRLVLSNRQPLANDTVLPLHRVKKQRRSMVDKLRGKTRSSFKLKLDKPPTASRT